jgi:hypothetical protein
VSDATKVDQMNTVFNLIDAESGKHVTQSTTLSNCVREAKWRGAKIKKGRLTDFRIERLARDGWFGLRARSNRFGSKWPAAKDAEFARQYGAMVRMHDLCAFFDTSSTGIVKARKRLRLPQRSFPRPEPQPRLKINHGGEDSFGPRMTSR